MNGDTFVWEGQALPYLDAPYNVTRRNERAVEVPLAQVFLAGHGHGRGLEVGNVLGHYGVSGHDVVDLYEAAPGVRNIDIFDLTGTWDWIVSISTIEHIETTNVLASVAALDHMRGLLSPQGRLFVTAGLGQNPHLDDALYTETHPYYQVVYRRSGPDWSARNLDDADAWAPYDWRTPSARAVWIATFLGEP